MKQSEEQVDSEVLEPDKTLNEFPDIPEEFKNAYVEVVMNNIGIRVEIENDLVWIQSKMLEAREASHSRRIELINDVVDYTTRAIDVLSEIRKKYKKRLSDIKEAAQAKNSDIPS